MTKRLFIVHGWYGSPEQGWFPWLKSEMQRKGFEVTAEKMPTNPPTMKEWLEYIRKLTGKVDENTYFVGHSAGTITILRYLEILQKNEIAGGAVLVSGFTDDLGFKELSNYFTKPINWNKIKTKCKKFVVINSDNDEWISLKHAHIFEAKLDAKIIIEHNKGHIDEASGVMQLQSILNSVLEISS